MGELAFYGFAGFVMWGAYLCLSDELPSVSNMTLCLILWPVMAAMWIGALLVSSTRRRS